MLFLIPMTIIVCAMISSPEGRAASRKAQMSYTIGVGAVTLSVILIIAIGEIASRYN